MRIILNDKLLSDPRFLTLSKEQMIALFKISTIFGNANSTTISLSIADSMHTQALIDAQFFSSDGESLMLIDKNINFFKNNNENVKKCLSKKSQAGTVAVAPPSPVLEAPKPAKAPKKAVGDDLTNWDEIRQRFNDLVDATSIPKIHILDAKRQALVRNAYALVRKMKNPADGSSFEFDSLEDFFEAYMTNLVLPRKGLCSGWTNKDGKSQFQPDFDFIFNKSKVTNIIERNMYK